MKFMNILLIFSALSLNAQVLNVTKDWNLIGAASNINDLTPFDDECVKSLFVYKNNNWLTYSKGEIQSIDKGIGFWLYASKDCTIDLPVPVASTTNTSAQPTPEQIANINNNKNK